MNSRANEKGNIAIVICFEIEILLLQSNVSFRRFFFVDLLQFYVTAPMSMESVLPPVPFQLLRDPNSGQFLFFPTAVPTAATSIGMFIAQFN